MLETTAEKNCHTVLMVPFPRAVNFEFLHENPQIKLCVTFFMLEDQFTFLLESKVGDILFATLVVVTNLN